MDPSEVTERWELFGERYPEVVEMLLSEVGLAEPSWRGNLSRDEEKVRDFVRDNFSKAIGEGFEDEIFQAFRDGTEDEIDEGPRLLNREYFSVCLKKCVNSGHLVRKPVGNRGVYYTTPLGVLLDLQEAEDTNSAEIQQIYRVAEEPGVPVQGMIWKAIDHHRVSLALTDVSGEGEEAEKRE